MKIRLDALANLAAAAGYQHRGDQPVADLITGIALSQLSIDPVDRVEPLEAENLIRAIYGIAHGQPKLAPPTVCAECGRRPRAGHSDRCQQCEDEALQAWGDGMVGARWSW